MFGNVLARYFGVGDKFGTFLANPPSLLWGRLWHARTVWEEGGSVCEVTGGWYFSPRLKKKNLPLFFPWKQNFSGRTGNFVRFRVKNFLIGRFGDSVHDPTTHRASSLLRPPYNNPPRGHITHFGNCCFGATRQIAFTFSTRLETKPAPIYLRLIWGVTVTRRQQKQQMVLVNASSLVFFHLFARHGKQPSLSGCPVWEKKPLILRDEKRQSRKGSQFRTGSLTGGGENSWFSSMCEPDLKKQNKNKLINFQSASIEPHGRPWVQPVACLVFAEHMDSYYHTRTHANTRSRTWLPRQLGVCCGSRWLRLLPALTLGCEAWGIYYTCQRGVRTIHLDAFH